MSSEPFKRYMVKDPNGSWRLPAYLMEESAKQDAQGKLEEHWEAWEVEIRPHRKVWPE